MITAAFLNPGTFGFTGVAFDGTLYYVFDDEAQPSQLVLSDAAGNFLNRLTLTGLPGPNDQAFISDLSAVVAAAPEPGSLALLGIALVGFGAFHRRTAQGLCAIDQPLASAGVPVWIDHVARIAHVKTMVIDGTMTLNGSYNWTRAASANSEDLNLVASPIVAEAYAAHWRDRQALSLRFDRREDWCRAGAR